MAPLELNAHVLKQQFLLQALRKFYNNMRIQHQSKEQEFHHLPAICRMQH